MKAPAQCWSVNDPSNTSTLPFAKSAAYRYGASLAVPIASPVYEPPSGEVARTVAAGPPAQPWIVPDWVAKMKREAVVPPAATGNAVEPLKTTPVGSPATATVSGTLAPVVPLYRVE